MRICKLWLLEVYLTFLCGSNSGLLTLLNHFFPDLFAYSPFFEVDPPQKRQTKKQTSKQKNEVKKIMSIFYIRENKCRLCKWRIHASMHSGFKWYEIDAFILRRQKPLSHELRSERVSERANEWAQRSTRANRAVRSKWMSERCKRTSERRTEWPSTLRVDFIVILPTVHCNEGEKQHQETRQLITTWVSERASKSAEKSKWMIEREMWISENFST